MESRSAACKDDGEGGPWANQVYVIKGNCRYCEKYTVLKIKPRWWIAKDSLGIVALGIVHDVTSLVKPRPN